jgi:hypothetical protein
MRDPVKPTSGRIYGDVADPTSRHTSWEHTAPGNAAHDTLAGPAGNAGALYPIG